MGVETRDLIIAATRRLIDSQGLDAVTLRAVGAEARLSRGAAYRHFEDKEALLAEIATEDLQAMLESFGERIMDYSSAEDRAKALLKEFYSYGMSNKDHYRLMFSMDWNQEKYPRLRERALAVFGAAEELIAGLVAEKKLAAGTATELAAIVFSFVHGLVELHLAGHFEARKGLADPDRLFDLIIGLLAGSPVEEPGPAS